MKLLMAEDLEPMRECLSVSLARTMDLDLRFVEQDAVPLLQGTAAWQPNLVILNASMRGGTALGLLEELKYEWPDISVAVSSPDFELLDRKTLLNRGADFLFHKSVEWEDLIAFMREFQAQAAWEHVDDRPTAPAD